MSVYHRSTAKSRILQEYRNREEEIAAALSRQMSPKVDMELSPKIEVESDKRIRREIANSNERRRMQSINAGFQVLRSMIPHSEGEKLSKAAILQQTTEYIGNLQQEKDKVVAQNSYFKRLLGEVSRRCNVDLDLDIARYGSPPTKRKKRDTESSDEGITADFEDHNKYEDIRRELAELRQQLERERQLRLKLLESRAHFAIKSHHQHFLEPVVQHAEKEHLEQMQTEKSMVVDTRLDMKEPLSYSRPAAEHECMSEPEHPITERSPHHRPDVPSTPPSSMSRRNLETIVEAIRHLEGDEITTTPTEQKFSSNHHSDMSGRNPQLQYESEKDSSVTSDQDDFKSESSGRDSPSLSYAKLNNVAQGLHHVSPALLNGVVVTSSSYMDKYPAVTNVLQGNMPQTQFFYRPGVIVQKS